MEPDGASDDGPPTDGSASDIEDVEDEAEFLQNDDNQPGASQRATPWPGGHALPAAALVSFLPRPADGGGAASQDPASYEALASQKRQSREQRSASSASDEERGARPKAAKKALFGAGVNEIWDSDLASKMGFAQTRPGARRRAALAEARRRRMGQQPKRRTLPPEVVRRMGEANLLYEEATERLLEVVRMAPALHEAYTTLGLVAEAQGQAQKALDFHMISAHLAAGPAAWRRLARLSRELGAARQAIYCLGRVIRSAPEDTRPRWDQAILFMEIGENQQALLALKAIAKRRPGHPQVATMLARLHCRAGQPARAIETLERHLADFPAAVGLSHVDQLAQLYMDAGSFPAAAGVLRAAEARLAIAGQALPVQLQVKVGICAMEVGKATDAQAAFACLLAQPVARYEALYQSVADRLFAAGQGHEALTFYQALRGMRRRNAPPLWARLAECWWQLARPEAAAEVYCEALADASQPLDAHIEAALCLAEAYGRAGRGDAAAEVLAGMAGLEAAAVDLDAAAAMSEPALVPPRAAAPVARLARKAALLLRIDMPEEFVALVLPHVQEALAAVRARDSAAGRNAPDAGADPQPPLPEASARVARPERGVFKGVERRRRPTRIGKREAKRAAAAAAAAAIAAQAAAEAAEESSDGAAGPARGIAGEAPVATEPPKPEAPPGPPPPLAGLAKDMGQFELAVRCGQLLARVGRASEARVLAGDLGRAFHGRWADARGQRAALRMVEAEAALAGGDAAGAVAALRAALPACPASGAAWNAYAAAVAALGGRPGTKFVLPLRDKHPGSAPLLLTAGHSWLNTGQPERAMREYLVALRCAPGEPLAMLCAGVAQCSAAMARAVPDRHRAVLQAFALLQEYARQRGNEQEAAYNLGRAAHQLGLRHLAVAYYERALAAPPPAFHARRADSAAWALADGGPSLDLRREAAHNLALLFCETGAPELARRVVACHLVF